MREFFANRPELAPTPLRELPKITVRAFPSLMMPVVLLGGIYTGITTPTEAAAVAAAYALAISVLLYRSVSFAEFYRAVLASARTSASIGMLIAGALVFNYVVTVENIPQSLSVLLTGWELSPATFLIVVNVILLLLGCVLEGLPAIVLMAPIMFPMARNLGIHDIHYAMVIVTAMNIGLMAPPIGIGFYIACKIGNVSPDEAMAAIWPSIAALLVGLAIIAAFPHFSTFFV